LCPIALDIKDVAEDSIQKKVGFWNVI
jgi:hypothetical protein